MLISSTDMKSASIRRNRQSYEVKAEYSSGALLFCAVFGCILRDVIPEENLLFPAEKHRKMKGRNRSTVFILFLFIIMLEFQSQTAIIILQRTNGWTSNYLRYKQSDEDKSV